MIKAVIFDADGVVIKPKRFSVELEKDFGIPTTKLLPFFDSVFEKHLTGKGDLKNDLHKYMDDWGWHDGVDKLMDYWFRTGSELEEGVVRKVEELRKQGIPCYIGTNQEKYRTLYMKKDMGLEDMFDGVWSSADLGFQKPDMEFFENIYKNITKNKIIRKEEIMFWDDREKNVESAERFGFNAYVFKNFADFEKIMEESVGF